MIERLFWLTAAPASETGLVYCSFAKPVNMSNNGGLQNSATGVTITAVYSAAGPFGVLSVGDRLLIRRAGADYSTSSVLVTAVNSNTEIETDTALDLSVGTWASWSWQKAMKGTADTDGWLSCAYWRDKSIKVYIATLPTGGFNLQIEGRYANWQGPSILYKRQYTATTDYPQIFPIPERVAALRVGLSRVSAGSDGSVTVSLAGDPSK